MANSRTAPHPKPTPVQLRVLMALADDARLVIDAGNTATVQRHEVMRNDAMPLCL